MFDYHGEIYKIEDVDNVNIVSMDRCERIEQERFVQMFYNTVVWRFVMATEDLKNTKAFYSILRHYPAIKKSFFDLCYLYKRDDYQYRVTLAIDYLYRSSEMELRLGIREILQNPYANTPYLDSLIMINFTEDIERWAGILNTYKRVSARINRLKYLIDQMDQLKDLRISCLISPISKQVKLYQKEIDFLQTKQHEP